MKICTETPKPASSIKSFSYDWSPVAKNEDVFNECLNKISWKNQLKAQTSFQKSYLFSTGSQPYEKSFIFQVLAAAGVFVKIFVFGPCGETKL